MGSHSLSWRLGALLLSLAWGLAASDAQADDTPGSRGGARVVAALDHLRANLQETRYQHHRSVRERRGQYFFDCSGMVQWVLSRAARRSALDLRDGRRPLAIDFVRRIERAPVDRFRGGWRRIEVLADVRPGDIFAWRRPENFRSANTGHVGFVIETPRPVPMAPHLATVRVADASRYTHQDDTRPWPGPGGYGEGTLVFSVDPDGHPTGYGWHGLRSQGTWATEVVFGRVGPPHAR